MLSKIKEGYNIYCVVREVEKGHLIGDIGGIDVHIPAFELSYGWVDDLRSMYKPGDHNREVVEMSPKKIKVSRKLLMENPFPECLSRYVSNGEYVGTVSGCTSLRCVCSVRRRCGLPSTVLKVPAR